MPSDNEINFSDAIDVVGTIRSDHKDPSNRDHGGRRGDRGRESAARKEARTNTETVVINGKSFKVSPGTEKGVKEFVREFAEQGIGRSIIEFIDGGEAWDAATQTRARAYLDRERLDAARRNNRGDAAAWDSLLKDLQKTMILVPRATEDPLLVFHRQVAAHRKEEKKKERKRQENDGRGGAADSGR